MKNIRTLENLYIRRALVIVQNINDQDLIAATLTCDEPCTCCSKEERTYLDPETRCAYCLECLTIACEPEEEEVEGEDAEIVAIGQQILAEMLPVGNSPLERMGQ